MRERWMAVMGGAVLAVVMCVQPSVVLAEKGDTHAQEVLKHTKEAVAHVKQAIKHIEEDAKATGNMHAKEALQHANEALAPADKSLAHAEMEAKKLEGKGLEELRPGDFNAIPGPEPLQSRFMVTAGEPG